MSRSQHLKESASQRRERRYRLTPERFAALVEAQEGLCAICRLKPPTDVDHSTKTGHVRGLLCRPCNLGLGMFADDPDRMAVAIAYLNRKTESIALAMPQPRRPNAKPLPRGEKCHSSKLTDEIVRAIRAEYAAGGVSYPEIGKKYGLHPVHVGTVVRRKTWAHVN
jgi:hypothetical protein